MNETSPKKKNKIISVVIGAVFIGAVIFGLKEYMYYQAHEDTDDAQIDADISPVVSRVGGYVDSIFFEDDSYVEEGQPLVKLDDRDYRIKLNQAVFFERSARANTHLSEAQILAMKADALRAKSNVEVAMIKLDKAQKDFNRASNLIKNESISQQEFERVKADRDIAEASRNAALKQYDAALEHERTAASQLEINRIGVEQRRSDIDYAALQLSYAQIKAPSSGFVSKRNIQKGQLVQAGQALCMIVRDRSLYVIANFKETQIGHIRIGQKADIEIDAFPDDKIEGEISAFSPATGAKFSLLPPDNATGNFVKVVQRVPVKIKIIHGNEKAISLFRPGMSAKVSVRIKE